MKRIITALLVVAMVVTMLPAFAISTSAAEKAKIEEGLNADWWLSVAELNEGESGHFDAYKRIMGWHGGYRASFDDNRKFDQAIDAMLHISAKTGTKTDITEFGGGFGRDDYKAASKINSDNEYMVNWKGTIKATTAGTYKFIGNKVDNGCVIFVNGEKAYEYWGASYYFDGNEENLISEQSFTITADQVGKDIPFEMWFLEIDGGEALAFTVTDNGELSGKKTIADAGFTFSLTADYYTCKVKGDEHGDIEKHMQDGVKVDDNGNGSSAAEPGNHTFSEEQLNNIKGEMLKVGSSIVADMDNKAYQDQQVCQQFGFHYDDYMVEYTGYLTPSITGNYTFGTQSVDNCFILMLKINGEWKTVYEFWAKGIFNDRAATYSGDSFDLVAGESYELRAIFLEINGGQPHQILVKNNGTGVVYNNLNSTMYLTTKAIAKADFTPKAASITLDGKLDDWAGTKSLSTNEGTGEFAGKKATFYAVVREEGIYLACEAYHNVFKTDAGAWHENTNFEFFLRETGHVQYWVTAGQNGRANNLTSAFIMKNETLSGAATTYKTVTEVFIANCDLPNDTTVREGVARVGLAWKTVGDDKNNAHHGGTDNWWCPVYAANAANKHFITENGLYADSEFTFDVATADELMAYVKMVNAGTANHNNFTRNLTLNITADIDLTGYDWTPISRWVGTINGNNKTISGIKYVTDSNNAYAGLFINEIANNDANGSVYNLNFKDSIIVAKNTREGVGGIAGMVDRGRIVGCSVDNVTVIGGNWVGGITGRACWGTEGDNVIVKDCMAINGTVVGTGLVGSIVGTTDNSTLDLGNYVVENMILKSTGKVGEVVGEHPADKAPLVGDTADAKNVETTDKIATEIISGAENEWNAEAPAAITIVTNGTDNAFAGIKIDGKAIKASSYTVEEKDGTLTITFKESFLKGLDNGEHTVTVVNLDGDLEAKLTATGNVKTGDMSFIIVLVSTLALGAIVVTSKKRRMAK